VCDVKLKKDKKEEVSDQKDLTAKKESSKAKIVLKPEAEDEPAYEHAGESVVLEKVQESIESAGRPWFKHF